ncbi:MAG: diaminopimelate decarboxylase, partial [Gemmatimonadales bacterium]
MSRPHPPVLEKIAALQGTPTYVYSACSLNKEAGRWVDAAGDASRIFFAAKANSNLAVLDRLRRTGIGIEVATAGERARAEQAGFPPDRILLGGVPKAADVVANAIGSVLALVVLQADHEVDAAIEGADPAR